MNDWAASILNSNQVVAVPIMTHPGIDMIENTVLGAVTDGETHANAIIALSSEYPSAAATVIMDLTVEAEAFGAKLVFPDHEVPSVVDRLLQSDADIMNLVVPSLDAARVPEYIKANKIAAQKIVDKPLFSGCIGPFSLAGRLFDMTEMMMSIYINPEMATMLLDKCTDFIVSYAKALKDTGANGLVIAEPAAGLLSDDDAMTYSTVFVRRIVEAVQDENFMVVLHNCGNSGHCTNSMIQSGANALHFGNKINILEALKDVPSDILVMGNLDPVSVMRQATAENVAEATKSILEKTSEYKNYVLSTGCDTPPGTPLENISAFYGVLEDYNKSL